MKMWKTDDNRVVDPCQPQLSLQYTQNHELGPYTIPQSPLQYTQSIFNQTKVNEFTQPQAPLLQHKSHPVSASHQNSSSEAGPFN